MKSLSDPNFSSTSEELSALYRKSQQRTWDGTGSRSANWAKGQTRVLCSWLAPHASHLTDASPQGTGEAVERLREEGTVRGPAAAADGAATAMKETQLDVALPGDLVESAVGLPDFPGGGNHAAILVMTAATLLCIFSIFLVFFYLNATKSQRNHLLYSTILIQIQKTKNLLAKEIEYLFNLPCFLPIYLKHRFGDATLL